MTVDDRRTGGVDRGVVDLTAVEPNVIDLTDGHSARRPGFSWRSGPSLEVVDLYKSYGDLTAVQGVSFAVEAGAVLGLLGPNGAGKSTTVGCVAGLLTPDAGAIRLNLSARARRSRAWLGLATQELALFPDLTVWQNLRFFGRLGTGSTEVFDNTVSGVVDHLGLEALLSRRVRDLSGGQQRLAHVAVAAAHAPKVLILDEPTAGLDVRARGLILEFVRWVASVGTAVVYSSHYLQEVEEICDSVVIIDRGRCIARGTVDELIARHGAGQVEVDVAGATHVSKGCDVAAAVASVASLGPVDDIRVLRPSLEAVFVELTGASMPVEVDS